jgi:AcrR family transcriptional regulator
VAGGDRKSADAVLVAALAAGETIADAATRAGVGERTVYRRLEDAEFCAVVRNARAALVDGVVGALTAASSAAVMTLKELLDPASPPTVRLGAAKAIIELGTKARDAEDVTRRLEDLEEAILRLRTPSADARDEVTE